MFKMNPSAKEFVPAHILKKRQEDAERLGELTQQLDKVDLDPKKGKPGNEESSSRNKSSENSKRVQDVSSSNKREEGDVNASSESSDNKSTSPSTNNQQQNNHPTQEVRNNVQHSNNNNHNEGDYPDDLQDLIDEEDDRFLLNAGENLCEFNGEQFIIPGDDEYEPAVRAGYDFGNTEDNEDEDVCNAFEEFLENLPSQ